MHVNKTFFKITSGIFYLMAITAMLFFLHSNLVLAGAWEDNNCQWVGSEGVYLKCQCWDGSWKTATTVNNALQQCPSKPSPPAAPSVTLQVKNVTDGSAWTTSDITIDYSDQIYLSWSSSNASSCSGSNFTVSGTSGTQTTVTEPSGGGSTTYTVSCTGSGGTRSDSVTVTKLDNEPTATIRLRNVTLDTAWTSNIQINIGDQVGVYWSSTNAEECYGFGWSTGSSTAGTTEDVEEPDGETSASKGYGLGCVGPGGVKYSNTPTAYIYHPTVSLQVRNVTTGGSWTGSDIVINEGDEIEFSWTSTNAVSCTGTNFTMNGTDSTQTVVTEPTAGNSTTYTATCSNARGDGNDSITVTANAAPTATLQVSSDGGSTWTGSDITIDPTDEISLQWSSANADSCSGYNFSTGGSTGSTQSSVTEPTAGNSTTYTVVCSSGGAQDSDSLQVTVDAGVGASITTSDTVVHSGSTVTLTWDVGTSDPSTCEIRQGSEVLSGYSSLATVTGSLDYTVNAESTFILDCESGVNTDSTTVTVLPEFMES